MSRETFFREKRCKKRKPHSPIEGATHESYNPPNIRTLSPFPIPRRGAEWERDGKSQKEAWTVTEMILE